MDQYPIIKLIVERGNVLAVVVALLPLCAAVAAVAGAAWHWLALIAGVIGGLVVYVLLKSYVELVRVMADMLIPK
ncbi:MAG: hypothetical protein HY525_19715 [Betaproteobacteria bacterium]|nr:hypothetical protein [Betaproteobacteria bacterium]